MHWPACATAQSQVRLAELGQLGGLGSVGLWEGQPGEGYRIWHLGHILTPILAQSALHICIRDFAGAAPSCPIGAAGVYPRLRRKYPLTLKWALAAA